MSTIASGGGRLRAAARRRSPSARDPDPAPRRALTSVTIRPSRSAISSKSTCSSTAWLSVSCTIAIEPTRRTASSSAAWRLGHVDPAGLEPQQRRHGLQVVLHPVVDLADGGVLGDQLAVAAAQVGDVAQQHQRPDALALRAAAGSRARSARPRRCRSRCRGGARPPSTALSVSSSGRAAAAPARGSASASDEAGEVAVQARAGGRPRARWGWRRRPGPAASTRTNPSPTRGESAWSLRWPGSGKCPRGDHLGQVGGGLQVGQLEPAGRAHAEQVGVARDRRRSPGRRGARGSSRPAPARRRATPGRPRAPAGRSS